MIVYMPGTGWDSVVGTDRSLALALSAHDEVAWIDPPVSLLRLRSAMRSRGFRPWDRVAPGILRVRTVGPPGLTRPIVRTLVRLLVPAYASLAVMLLGKHVRGVVLASPEARFPPCVRGPRLLFVTDDWVAGAELMGLSERWIKRVLAANGRGADVVAAVTPVLAAGAAALTGHADVRVLPNGVRLPPSQAASARLEQARPRMAALIGQLNERLDLEALERAASLGVEMVVIGPRRDRDPAFGRRLDALLDRPEVRWLGELPADALAEHLARARVGLTPYVDSAFNRASFPLKTLEYLAAGLPVVASDLPAVRWLETDLVEIASDSSDFANRVVAVLDRPVSGDEASARVAFARNHSWEVRARTVIEMLTPTA